MLIAFTTTAQKAVKLTNTKTQKTITLKEGKRVIYSLKDSPEKKIGILNSITESTLMISDEEVPVSDIDAFGRNNKGNRFWAITEFILGGGVIISSIQNASYDPCSSCTQGESTGGGYMALEIGIGLGLIGLGTHTIVRNLPKDLTDDWRMEIIAVSK